MVLDIEESEETDIVILPPAGGDEAVTDNEDEGEITDRSRPATSKRCCRNT